MNNRSLEINKTQGDEVSAACPKCIINTAHSVCVSVDTHDAFRTRGFEYDEWVTYQVIQCLGCKTISFRKASENTEDEMWDPDTETSFLRERVELYPNRMNGRRELPDSKILPPLIRNLYKEVLVALINKASVLAGIGIRALVEAVCKERKASGKTLENRIDDLVQQSVLTNDGAEILHSLRLMGNEAAHEAKPYNDQELYMALDIAENLLNTVYLIPKKAAELPGRKKTT